jgi:hypothetical protein
MNFIKAAAPYIGAIVFSVGIFMGGLYVGMDFTTSIAASIFNPHYADKTSIDAMEDHAILTTLDTAGADKAIAYLRVREDANILSLDSIDYYADPQTRSKACRLLKAIAARRAKYPEKTTQNIGEIQAAVDAILKAPKVCNEKPA